MLDSHPVNRPYGMYVQAGAPLRFLTITMICMYLRRSACAVRDTKPSRERLRERGSIAGRMSLSQHRPTLVLQLNECSRKPTVDLNSRTPFSSGSRSVPRDLKAFLYTAKAGSELGRWPFDMVMITSHVAASRILLVLGFEPSSSLRVTRLGGRP